MKKLGFFKILFTFLLVASISNSPFAHCDTMDGAVVKDAQIALDKGDVTPVLKWVKKDAETEVSEAFLTAIIERKKGAKAKESADKKFFETLIRVHRAGKGADFTGLKPAGSVEPIIAEADKAIESGSADKNKETRVVKKMKVLKIKWQRLLSDKQTCPRCGSTEKELEKAVSTLQQCLIPLGIRVALEKDELSIKEFKKDPLRSNRIWLNNRLLEDWIGGKVGQSQCRDVCGPTKCRTVGIGGEVYEVIPTDLVIKAGLLAASQLLSPDNNKSCSKNEAPTKKSGGSCPK